MQNRNPKYVGYYRVNMSSVSGLQIFHKKLKEIGIKGKVTAALKNVGCRRYWVLWKINKILLIKWKYENIFTRQWNKNTKD